MYLLSKMVIFQPAILVYWREPLYSTGSIFEATNSQDVPLVGQWYKEHCPSNYPVTWLLVGSSTKPKENQQNYPAEMRRWGLKKAPMLSTSTIVATHRVLKWLKGHEIGGYGNVNWNGFRTWTRATGFFRWFLWETNGVSSSFLRVPNVEVSTPILHGRLFRYIYVTWS